MDLVKLSIPANFVRKKGVPVSWRDVLFGIDNELYAPGDAVDLAMDQVATEQRPPPMVVELAGLRGGEPTRELVARLAAAEPGEGGDNPREKWLYLVLSWIFEHRDDYMDPLQMVEMVYADFGYPDKVAPFVRYMPSADPRPMSQEDGVRCLYEKWRQYLDDAAAKFAAAE